MTSKKKFFISAVIMALSISLITPQSGQAIGLGLGALIEPLKKILANLQKGNFDFMGDQFANLSDKLNSGIDDLGTDLNGDLKDVTDALRVDNQRGLVLDQKILEAEVEHMRALADEQARKDTLARYKATMASCVDATTEIRLRNSTTNSENSEEVLVESLRAYGSGEAEATKQGADKIVATNNNLIKKLDSTEGPLKSAYTDPSLFLGSDKYNDVPDAALHTVVAESVAVILGPVPEKPDEDDAEAMALYAQSSFQYSTVSSLLSNMALTNNGQQGQAPHILLKKKVTDHTSDAHRAELESMNEKDLLEQLNLKIALTNQLLWQSYELSEKQAMLSIPNAIHGLTNNRVNLNRSATTGGLLLERQE